MKCAHKASVANKNEPKGKPWKINNLLELAEEKPYDFSLRKKHVARCSQIRGDARRLNPVVMHARHSQLAWNKSRSPWSLFPSRQTVFLGHYCLYVVSKLTYLNRQHRPPCNSLQSQFWAEMELLITANEREDGLAGPCLVSLDCDLSPRG